MKLINTGHIKYKGIFGLFLLGFLLLFISFPLTNSLPGNTDGWAYISFFRSYNNSIASLFNNAEVGQSFYPNRAVYMYGDPCVLGALFYLPFQWLGANVVWAWALMLTMVYTFTAFSASLFFKQYTGNKLLGIVAGLMFSTSGFLWGNVDSPNAFYFGTFFLSMYFSLLFFNSGLWKHLLLAVLAGASTLYFSSYIFVFQALVLLVLWLFNWRVVLGLSSAVNKLTVALTISVVLVLPYIYFIGNSDGMLNMWNPVREFEFLRVLSLGPSDLLRPAIGNLFYPMKQDHLAAHTFFYSQHAAWVGVVLWLLAVCGLVIGKRKVWIWVIIFLVGLLVAVGPTISIAGDVFKTPIALLYDVFGLDMAIRNPVRFWFLCIIGLIGLATITVQWMLENTNWGKYLLPIICVVYVLENVPLLMRHHNVEGYADPDNEYIDMLRAQQGAVVLELPSSIYSYDVDFPVTLNEYQREHIYQYWQTIHRQNILNGSNAFIPPARMRVLELVNNLTEADSLQSLIKDFKVDLIVFHKDLTLQQDDPTLESYLKADTTMVELKLETSRTVIFSTTDQ